MSIFSNLFTQLFLHTICHTEQAYVTRFQQIFKNTVFPSTIIDWNKLDWKIKNSEILRLKKRTLSFIRSSPNSTFNCHNPKGIKLLSRLKLGSSHLRKHKFKLPVQFSRFSPPLLQLWKR